MVCIVLHTVEPEEVRLFFSPGCAIFYLDRNTIYFLKRFCLLNFREKAREGERESEKY